MRRKSSEPITFHWSRGFNATSAGTCSLAAASASSPNVACLPEACDSTPFSTLISPAGTFHCLAAALTSMVRASAPALR